MSIKEKALQIKQDFDDVHEAGKQKVISQSKYIPKTAAGTVISLTDVSEVAHKVKVYGDNQEVNVYGGNLCDYTKAESRDLNNTVTFNADGSLNYTGTYYFRIPVNLERGTEYTLSFDSNKNSRRWCFAYNAGNETSKIDIESKTTSTDKDVKYVYIYPNSNDAAVETTTISNIRLNWGAFAKPYEPYTKQTITATPEGTEVSSICPNMTFIADSDITVDYYSSFGMNVEWDRNWDTLQVNGTRQRYEHAFRNNFSAQTFKPKYDIVPTSAAQMFYESPITDLAGILKKQGVILDTQKCTNATYMFTSSKVSRLPLLDFSVATGLNSIFYKATNLRHIEGIVSSETTPWNNNDIFAYLSALEHVIFSGVIASDINLQWSPLLDEESLVSLAVTLQDWISTDSSQIWTRTVTVSGESRAILESTLYPDTEVSCLQVIEGKGWNIE